MKKERRHGFHHHLFMQATPVLTSILAWTTMLNQHQKACQDFVGHLVIRWVLFLKSVYQVIKIAVYQVIKTAVYQVFKIAGTGSEVVYSRSRHHFSQEAKRKNWQLAHFSWWYDSKKYFFFLLLFSYLLVAVALILYSLLPLFLFLWLWYFTTMMTE